MDACCRYDCTNDRKSVPIPSGGHGADYTYLASRSPPSDSPGALAAIPGKSLSDSDGPYPSADDSSSSDSVSFDSFPGDSFVYRPELRFGDSADGPGYFIRDEFLDYYGDIDGIARWVRATVYNPDVGAAASNADADTADGSGANGDDVAGSRDGAAYADDPPIAGAAACRATHSGRAGIPRTCNSCGEEVPSGTYLFAHHLTSAYECPNAPAPALGTAVASATPPRAASEAALPVAASPTTEPVSSAIGVSVASGASGARDTDNLGRVPAASSTSAPAPDLPSLLAGLRARMLAPDSSLASAPDLPGLLVAILAILAHLLASGSSIAGPLTLSAAAAHALGAGAAGAATPGAASAPATSRAHPPAAADQALDAGADGLPASSASRAVATPRTAPSPPPPPEDPSDPPAPNRRDKRKAPRALARAAARAAKVAAQITAAADAERSKLARAAKSRAQAQLTRQARQAAKDRDEAEAAVERKALDTAHERAVIESQAPGELLGIYRTTVNLPPPPCAEDAKLTATLAAAKTAAGRGAGSPSLCCVDFCLKPLTPSGALMRRCREYWWPLPRRCWAHRRARASAFAHCRLRDSADGPGGELFRRHGPRSPLGDGGGPRRTPGRLLR